MATRARELGQSAIAITDHGNTFGLLKFNDACKKVGVKPIFGMEAYVAPGSMLVKEAKEGERPYFHLLLLAMNNIGLKNLFKLSTLGYTQGFYYKPRIDLEVLATYNEGLIVSSACIKGQLPSLLLADQYCSARDHIEQMKGMLGDRYYIELMTQGFEEQVKVLPHLIELAREANVQLIATTDAHYARREDAKFHEQLVMIHTGGGKDKGDSFKFATDQLYLKSEAEMLELFKDCPEAVHNTQLLANRCSATFADKYPLVFPKLTEDDATAFEQAARLGLARLAKDKDPAYCKRLDYEIDVIKKMGFPSYFMVVADLIGWARANGIAVGPGRGSAAGSLAAYCLGITEIDPLKYSLLFERFLNPGRAGSSPDIDTDFDPERREDIIQNLHKRYPNGQVSQIITFGEFKPRVAIRDFGRVQGKPYELCDKAAKMVPLPVRGHDPTWERTRKEVPELFRGEYAEITSMACKSEGLIRQAGIHAAGVVIADKPLVEYIPLCLNKDDLIITQWDMEEVERVGLVKMDILGIKALTVVDTCLKMIKKSTGEDVCIQSIPEDEQEAYDIIARGDTDGIFQFDAGGGIKELGMKLKPQSITDLANINALFRPGPLDGGLTDAYVERHAGRAAVEYRIPELKPILSKTYGIMIYQEQAMKIATDLAGFSLAEADMLRKAIGKKKPEMMKEQKNKLIKGMTTHGIVEQEATNIFEDISHHADYSFCAAHSIAYSVTTYRTCWLKLHYPVEFYCALLANHTTERDKSVMYLARCREVGIEVLPPDVNESEPNFVVNKGKIRFGLAGIRDIGDKVAGRIVEERQKGAYKSVQDLYMRTKDVGLNKRTLEALTKAGALSSLGCSRSGILVILDELVELPKRQKAYASKMETYQKKLMKHQDREQERNQQLELGGKPRPPLALPEAPKEPVCPDIPDLSELPIDEVLKMEREMLGFYVSGHPLYGYSKEITKRGNTTTEGLIDHFDGERVKIVTVITGFEIKPTKKGTKIATLDLEDLTGHTEAVMFSRQLAQYEGALVEGAVVLVEGRVEAEEASRRLILDSIEQIKAKPPQPTSATIKLSLKDVSSDMLHRVEEIITASAGDIDVKVLVEVGSTIFQLEHNPRLSRTGLDKLSAIKTLRVS